MRTCTHAYFHTCTDLGAVGALPRPGEVPSQEAFYCCRRHQLNRHALQVSGGCGEGGMVVVVVKKVVVENVVWR